METENSPVDLDTYDYTDWKKRTAVFLVSQNISLFGSSMMLILSCVFGVLGKGVGKGILNVAAVGSDFPLMTIYHIGSLLGCLVYVIIYAFAGKCIYLTWNLAFGLLATGLLLNGFVFQAPELAVVFAFLFGIGNTIGMSSSLKKKGNTISFIPEHSNLSKSTIYRSCYLLMIVTQ